MEYQPTLHTIIFITLFLIGYLFGILRRVTRHAIDFYDLLLLMSIAIIPSSFVFFPKLADDLARLFGVSFPFVVLFGMLFFIVFVYLYRLVIRSYDNDQRIILLLQELSLLRLELQQQVNAANKKR